MGHELKAPLLVTRGLSRRFGARVALDSVSLSLEDGERLAVLGASGSGKTTLLRLIAGLDAPSSGEVLLRGHLASTAEKVLLAPEKRGVALVFQGLALFPHMTAEEQLRFAGASAQRSHELLSSVGLADRARSLPDELSGGERQRLALVRALAQEPRLLLLDEPFANLDASLHASLREEMRSLLERARTTLVLVTHAREDALALSSRLIVLDHGRSVASGDLDALVARPGSRAVVSALGLGFLLEGRSTSPTEVQTPLGPARARLDGRSGDLSLLVRPEQARVLGEQELGGVACEVLGVAIASPESPTLRHSAQVRTEDGATYPARAGSPVPRPGARVRVAIEGELEVLDT